MFALWNASDRHASHAERLHRCARKRCCHPSGATRINREFVEQDGFATKKAAGDAETIRCAEVLQQYEMEKSGGGVAAVVPATLGALVKRFLAERKDKLAPKTLQGYEERIASLDTELLKLPLKEITPRRLNREWKRLLESGGHTRGTKTPRQLSAVTAADQGRTILQVHQNAKEHRKRQDESSD
jgi:hypothetical protein